MNVQVLRMSRTLCNFETDKKEKKAQYIIFTILEKSKSDKFPTQSVFIKLACPN